MTTTKINKRTFTAHLYLGGRPVVLNQQRLQKVLLDLRITQGEQLDAEVGLADQRISSSITLAGHEDDKPLVLKFVPHNDVYSISLVHAGEFDGARLFIEEETHNLLASTSAAVQYFSISTYGALKASLSDIEAGPAYVGLSTEPNGKPVYPYSYSGVSTFMNVDPNKTGHNAFRNKPAKFVIKVVK
ncbi:hypothetical protein HU727_014135 [Pseudomonas sp. SWRI153]|uniref:Uncharacterized protein n=1 Tax=Pseudomonas khorasanensis TaxID=2745508 RepID=A0A923F4R7_9PSED|nr:hypothetical protein [Pseudomonas khorasanensis]MBV4486733.1 hypothetical protein [Pseudomonas khorasanensis]